MTSLFWFRASNHGKLKLRGIDAYNKGHYTKAIKYLSDYLKKYPKSHSELICRAKAYINLQDYNAAKKDLDVIVEIQPNAIEAWILRSHVCRNLKMTDQVLFSLGWALDLDPANQEALFHRAVCYYTRYNYREALNDVNIYLYRAPNEVPAIKLRAQVYHGLMNMQRSIADLDKCEQINERDLEVMLLKARVYRTFLAYEDALVELNKALYIDPNNAMAIGMRGDIYACMKLFTKAISDFDRSLALDPYHPYILLRRGELCSRMKDYPAALLWFSRSLSKDPDNPKTLGWRAEIYFRIRQYDLAYRDAKKALDIHPSEPVALCAMGSILEERKDYEGAIKCWTSAITGSSRTASLYYKRASIYCRQKVYNLALADANTAVRLEPRIPYMNLRGVCYYRLGRYEQALADFAIVLQSEPGNNTVREYVNTIHNVNEQMSIHSGSYTYPM
ncbi:7433_t:CDS:1 [Paraglomus occultum]|uniref:7433_t:CDS:1 n=1 Tax=Paraglomus occultum TaxID=144539 RepID=A0A9N9C1V8_9GLOM|nr:7433_t:CDS:1 [Paraglomus occultum]